MATGVTPVGDPTPEQTVDPAAERVEEQPLQEEPDYAAQLRETQKALERAKEDARLEAEKAKFYYDELKSRQPIEQPKPDPADPFAPMQGIDGYELLTAEGQGLPAFARIFKERGGFVTMDDVKALIDETVQHERAEGAAMGALYEEFPAIRTDKEFQEGVRQEALALTADPYFKALPDVARLRVAAANVELRRLREPKPQGETEAQRVARIAAQAAPKGGKPPAPPSEELTDEQKKYCDQLGVSYENFKKYGGTLNMIGGR